MRTVSWTVVLLSIAASASEGARAQEQEFAFFASATATYSDNAARTSVNEIPATALDGLVGLQFAHNSPELFASGQFSELQRIYVEGHLPDETVPNGNLDLVVRPAGELFSWSVVDTLGQISTQPFAALVANDRQTVNVLSTGPDLRIPLGAQNHLDLSGRYGNDHFGNADLDDHNYRGQGDLAHDFGSSGSRLAAVYSYERIDFELSTLGTADIQQAYGELRLAGARTYLVLQGGEDELEELSNPARHTPHALALLQRHLTETLTFEAGYTHRYTNAGDAFVTDSRDVFSAGSDQTVQAVAQVFEQSYGYALLKRSQGRLQAAIDFTAGSETYPDETNSERHYDGADLAADYQLSSTFTFNVRAGYYKQTFPGLGQNERWVSGSVGVSRQLSPALLLSAAIVRYQGQGNVPNSVFTEDRAWLVLSYTPGAQRLQRIYDATAPLRLYDRPVVTPSTH
ncbi:MAG: hypothetical protein ACLPQ6_09170 [Steroidobacteraceae bacterium]